MPRMLKILTLIFAVTLLLAACATPTEETAVPEPTEAEAVEPPPEEEPEPEGEVIFFSTQFSPVEEQEKFRAILQEGGFDVTASDEGPLLDLIIAGQQTGQGEVDTVGALHGTYPPLAEEDAMMNMSDLAEDLMADRDFAPAFLETGLLGTEDYLYYVPWMQATYILAANTESLDYLPDGADVNALTWDEFAQWCQTILDETGEPKCGLPHAGLFHRFLEGYMWPSWTGGMVTNFRSDDAIEMMAWLRDTLWPTIHPQSINYEFMQEPLLSGEVWVAFDHTARLIEAFNTDPEGFVAFPAPAGAAGRGFMPVVVGLGIPNAAANPEGAADLIEYLTRPEIQGRILNELGFFPVVGGVDFSDLPAGVAIEAAAVTAQASAPDALPALLPVGLGERGGEINQIFKNAFGRIVFDGEDIATVLDEEGANLESLMNETGAPCWAPDEPSDGPCPVAPLGEAPEPTTGEVIFFSTQFSPVEEQEKFRAILQEGGFDVTASDEGPLLDLVIAGAQTGQGEVDAVGALHGTYPPLAEEDAMMNMIDIAEDLMADRDFAPAFLETGLLGTDDYLYYVPWMQATYIMAANTEALGYLPDGADVNAITWDEFGQWCQNILDETGEPKCGLPHAGLFHRFLEGYMWPSFTGGMVTTFASDEAVSMMEWARDTLWPTIHPQSINYEFMQEPLLSGEVWVAFDHTARLIEAFNTDPEGFVAFPAPAGPAGRGFMPVIVGLGIPKDAANPEGAADLIEYLTRTEIQGRILNELGFFPVVTGVDFSNLPAGVAIEAAAVTAQASSPDALPALLPVGLGERGGEINQIFKNAFDRIVLDGEDIATVLMEEAANLQALMNETGAPCWPPDPPSDGPCQVIY
ncbi:MAG: extracellular solute-binding protein [Chloroflexota bacterium]|nr:extracellular solute-binding protein [Chloroflexota bacterium]